MFYQVQSELLHNILIFELHLYMVKGSKRHTSCYHTMNWIKIGNTAGSREWMRGETSFICSCSPTSVWPVSCQKCSNSGEVPDLLLDQLTTPPTVWRAWLLYLQEKIKGLEACPFKLNLSVWNVERESSQQ